MACQSILSPTAQKIFASWARDGVRERPRDYVGASSIGHPCEQFLWLQFRNIIHETFDGRMYRLFDRGKREEEVFANDLRRIGIEVKPFDDNGRQFYVGDFGGHFAGHLDGVAKGFDEAPKQWFVVEFKTHSDASFKKLCKEGVKVAKPQHYAQMQVYMGKTGLKKAFYMAVNKDNDDLWCETLDFCENAYKNLLNRAFHIITDQSADKCANRPDDFRCKSCAARALCWPTEKTLASTSLPISCKTCVHASANIADCANKAWECARNQPMSDGPTECPYHLLLPTLVRARCVTRDLTCNIYETESGVTFANGNGPSQFHSAELTRLTADDIATTQTIKDVFPGAMVTGSLNLAYKHRHEPFVFDGTIDELRAWMRTIVDVDWKHPTAKEHVCECDFLEFPGYFLQIAPEANRGCARRTEENPETPF